ncbi:hypothetical protein C8Q77DRAFT_1142972 [Trametes polyzona]|nr:hypothetical protein C8Q77DRAFT_1142972 [Trametes polyzona]
MPRSPDALSFSTEDLADYDVLSDGLRSLESSIADLDPIAKDAGGEPAPLPTAREKFGDTVGLTAEDIQAYVQRSLGAPPGTRANEKKTWRVYVDGIFGPLTPRDVLQLRQAKLSFPFVHLVVGVFPDEVCEEHDAPTAIPHADRCEVLRHLRWVDEVVPDAPWTLYERFLRVRHIDYVAIDEGTSIDPDVDRDRLKGYDLVKSLRKAIPTRKTNTSTPMPRNVDPFKRDADKAEAGPPSADRTAGGVVQEVLVHVTPMRAVQDALETPFEEPKELTPFEEPKVDEFGTGHGV